VRRPLIAASLIALAFPLIAACGSDGGDTGAAASTPPTAATSPSAAPTPLECDKKQKDIPTASTTVGETPNITQPEGAPPCKLIVKDLKVGKGKAITDTSTTYDWNYEGVAWSTGTKFDSSFDRGQSIPFALNQVIPGWTEGLQGMKPGGRRLLVIPPEQGYGEVGSPPAIGPNETLVFVVDLVGPAS
jgi:peptidylprolyl isomerase